MIRRPGGDLAEGIEESFVARRVVADGDARRRAKRRVLDDIVDAVIVIGGSGDKEYADRMVTHLNVPYQNLTGKTGLLEAAAILQLTKLFIGNDSGLGHIASSLSIPSITLFGGGDPQRYRPWGPQALWPQGKNNDINSITVEDVSKLMLKQLAN